MMKYIGSLLAITLVVAAAQFGIWQLLEWTLIPAHAFLYLYMLGWSLAFDQVLLKQKDPKRFVNYYMGFSGGKLMLSLFILVLFGLISPENLRSFALGFLLVYFAFTAYEINRLLRHLKN